MFVMIFTSLPTGCKKALVQYFGFECFDERFRIFFDLVNLSDLDWEKAIHIADRVWSDRTYELVTVPVGQAKRFIMHHSPDLVSQYSSFDQYHCDYVQGAMPKHNDASWPVLALPSCGEALLDGWHRFHSYVDSGFTAVHFILLEDCSCIA
ncbi:MAG: hypothetical protein C9356_11980 [Oleiphilus sp.]|nr:MAG: hypothetical protein C9356_11980 [Oleiphilus sp.]